MICFNYSFKSYMFSLDETFVYSIFSYNDYTIDYYRLIEISTDTKYTLEFVKRELYDNDGWLLKNYTHGTGTKHKAIYSNNCMKIRSYFDRRRYFNLLRYKDILQDIEVSECSGISKMEDVCSDFYLEHYVLPRFI